MTCTFHKGHSYHRSHLHPSCPSCGIQFPRPHTNTHTALGEGHGLYLQNCRHAVLQSASASDRKTTLHTAALGCCSNKITVNTTHHNNPRSWDGSMVHHWFERNKNSLENWQLFWAYMLPLFHFARSRLFSDGLLAGGKSKRQRLLLCAHVVSAVLPFHFCSIFTSHARK